MYNTVTERSVPVPEVLSLSWRRPPLQPATTKSPGTTQLRPCGIRPRMVGPCTWPPTAQPSKTSQASRSDSRSWCVPETNDTESKRFDSNSSRVRYLVYRTGTYHFISHGGPPHVKRPVPCNVAWRMSPPLKPGSPTSAVRSTWSRCTRCNVHRAVQSNVHFIDWFLTILHKKKWF